MANKTNPLENPPSVDSYTRTIELTGTELDGGGGYSLEGLVGTVHVSGKKIQALDVQNSPKLTGLDLSDCNDDLRLHLLELPSLNWIKLPRGQIGSSIELTMSAAYKPIVPLVFNGPIAEFGLAMPWANQPWRLIRKKMDRPIQGLALGPPSARPAGHVDVLVLSGRATHKKDLVVDGRGLSQLYVLDAGIRTLMIDNASLERLQVSRCPKLEHVDGRFQARQAGITMCSALERVGGSGTRLSISHTRHSSLTLEGRWLETRVAIANCLTLKVKRPVRLELENVPLELNIDSDVEYRAKFNGQLFSPPQLAKRLYSRPGELGRIVQRAGVHFGDRSNLTTHWLLHLCQHNSSRDIQGVLSVLNKIADCEEDREACWLIRCQLAAQYMERATDVLHSRYAFRRGSSEWSWTGGQLPSHEHWLEDVILYAKCADLEVVRPFRRTLGRINRLIHANALASGLTAARQGAFQMPDEIQHHLHGALERMNLLAELENDYDGLPDGRPLPMRGFFSRTSFGWSRFVALVQQLIKHVVKLQDDELARLLAVQVATIDDVRFLLEQGCYMHSIGLPHWQKVLVAGMDSKRGKEPPHHIRERAMRLLLMGDDAD